MARERWIFEGVDKQRRAQIVRAVRDGQALPDPDDARIAVSYARLLTRKEKGPKRWMNRFVAVCAFAYLAIEFVVSLLRRGPYEVPSPALIFLFFYVLAHGVGLILARRVKENARLAERLNLEMAATAGQAAGGEDYSHQPEQGDKPPSRYPPFKEMWPLHALLAVGLIGIVLLRRLPAHSPATPIVALLLVATTFALIVFVYRTRKTS